MSEKLDAFNATIGAVGTFVGVLATLVVGWWRGQNSLNEVVDRRIQLVIEQQGSTIESKDTEITKLKESLTSLQASYTSVLERLERLIDEHSRCPRRDEFESMRHELALLRTQVDEQSEPRHV